ncbi:hypothetical protein [Methylibium sp.]|uniref:hypothetical protein n=1 Tax=Methylibium sp. TaxID=2067992 RepID=UPI00286C8560|nr:hypothetical protein [Methylibium sp.]
MIAQTNGAWKPFIDELRQRSRLLLVTTMSQAHKSERLGDPGERYVRRSLALPTPGGAVR